MSVARREGPDPLKLASQFLNNVINLPIETLPEKLKAYFTNHRITSGLPARTRNKTCPYCYIRRTDTNSSTEVLAARKPGAAMKRILRNVKEGVKLSPIEKKLAMRVSNNITVATTCHFCKMKATIKARKPVKIEPEVTIVFPDKKKKKKPEIVPSQPETTQEFIILDDTPSKNTTCNETTVLQNLSKRQRKRKRQKSNALSETSPGVSTILTIDDTKSTEPSLNKTAASGFIPLVSSTPLVVRGKATPPVTPTVLKNPFVAKKKRRSALQNMLAEETAKKKPMGRSSLRGFLSGL